MRSSASVLALLLTACGAGQGRAAPDIGYGGYAASGQASWYGEEVAGNPTASGERFDPVAITVAHRTLPLGSLVEITLPRTGRSVVARVTDRGPGRADRLIDLSRGTAQAIGLDRFPQSPVRIRAVSGDGYAGVRGPALPQRLTPIRNTGSYIVQVASFSYRPRAEALARALGGTLIDGDNIHRVQLGPFHDLRAAQQARDAAVARGYGDAQIR